jgi:hypothetical protein
MLQRCASILSFALASTTLLHAQTIFVTTVADVVDFAAPQTILQLPGADGKVSMREAAIAANNTAGAQTIGFHVPAGQWGTGTLGPVIINKAASFPISGDDTTVDGTTQTAFTGDTNPDGMEVAFHSTSTDVQQIQSGIFAITSDHNHFLGLGNMTGRNYGIDFLPTAEENLVTGCVIRGQFAAVRVQGDRNTIGGAAPSLANRLDSLSDGLRIHGFGANSADDNIVIGNQLTGDFNGVQLVGNATGNRIGGFAAGEPNVIAGAGYFQEDNTPDGAMVRIESDGNFVYGNFIGTDATGTAVADNEGDVGVEIYGDDNIVRGNVIGGITGLAGFLSVQAGVNLREGAENNVIQGNWIGVDKSGTIALGNRIGVHVSAFDSSLPMPGGNLIGGLGVGEANVIAHNEEGGVRVLLTSVGNRISGNQIRENHALGGLGIDLDGDGATPNDVGDADTGPNELMNTPLVLTAVGGSQGTVVTGRLDTPNPAAARLEFYSNPVPLPGDVVEAATLLGSGFARADGTFAIALADNAAGLVLTATATDAADNTSEISAPVAITTSPWVIAGFGISGTNGVPQLAGAGPLTAGSDVGLVLTNAAPLSAGFWVVGASVIHLPLFNGVLVPSPDASIPFATNASGAAVLLASWSAVPPGTLIAAQAGLIDPLALFGVAATPGVVGTSP